MTVKATCPCGGTFESSTGYHGGDMENATGWLTLHQDCVNIRVMGHQVSAKRASVVQKTAVFDWRSGFTFLNNDTPNLDAFQFQPSGNVTCIECDYVQAKNALPMHSDNCSHYEEK